MQSFAKHGFSFYFKRTSIFQLFLTVHNNEWTVLDAVGSPWCKKEYTVEISAPPRFLPSFTAFTMDTSSFNLFVGSTIQTDK